LGEVRRWAADRGATLVQIEAPCEQRKVAPDGAAADCDLIVSIGGDGTTLAAIRAGYAAQRPVLGVAWGSLGVLTAVAAEQTAGALERFSQGDWVPRHLPVLDVVEHGGETLLAINDVALVRGGDGQVFMTVHVDDVLCMRFAGDGCIVSTATGSSGYALAAGGPLLGAGVRALLITPLSAHGGSCPPLVVSDDATIRLGTIVRHNHVRLELDGRVERPSAQGLTIGLRSGGAIVVGFDDQEPLITGLRRRRIIIDSPRILADDERR
jgi:NAD+ kinase